MYEILKFNILSVYFAIAATQKVNDFNKILSDWANNIERLSLMQKLHFHCPICFLSYFLILRMKMPHSNEFHVGALPRNY